MQEFKYHWSAVCSKGRGCCWNSHRSDGLIFQLGNFRHAGTWLGLVGLFLAASHITRAFKNHMLQDMTENIFEETEMAKTVREIRARDPNFDMVKFLRSLRHDVRPVITVGALFDCCAVHCAPWAGRCVGACDDMSSAVICSQASM
jgi:hypothetical protein